MLADFSSSFIRPQLGFGQFRDCIGRKWRFPQRLQSARFVRRLSKKCRMARDYGSASESSRQQSALRLLEMRKEVFTTMEREYTPTVGSQDLFG